MIIGTLVVAVAASGCGNAIDTDIVGRTALARDADGSVLVLVDACRGSVDSIGIYAGRDGLADSEVNPTLGEIRASSPQSGRIEVPLTPPPTRGLRIVQSNCRKIPIHCLSSSHL